MTEHDLGKLRKATQEIAQQYRLDVVVLFGSQARGRTHRQSDIDIGFLSDKDYGPTDTARIERALKQAAQESEIDLVNLKGVSPLLLRHVATVGIPLYEAQPSAFALFQMYAFKRAVEAKPLLELQRQSLHRFVQTV